MISRRAARSRARVQPPAACKGGRLTAAPYTKRASGRDGPAAGRAPTYPALAAWPMRAFSAAAARADGPPSSRLASCRRTEITVRPLAALASPMALRASLECDLPRQISAPIRRTGVMT